MFAFEIFVIIFFVFGIGGCCTLPLLCGRRTFWRKRKDDSKTHAEDRLRQARLRLEQAEAEKQAAELERKAEHLIDEAWDDALKSDTQRKM